jgi:hypothetical protein
MGDIPDSYQPPGWNPKTQNPTWAENRIIFLLEAILQELHDLKREVEKKPHG